MSSKAIMTYNLACETSYGQGRKNNRFSIVLLFRTKSKDLRIKVAALRQEVTESVECVVTEPVECAVSPKQIKEDVERELSV